MNTFLGEIQCVVVPEQFQIEIEKLKDEMLGNFHHKSSYESLLKLQN
jgi:hypothetical protein